MNQNQQLSPWKKYSSKIKEYARRKIFINEIKAYLNEINNSDNKKKSLTKFLQYINQYKYVWIDLPLFKKFKLMVKTKLEQFRNEGMDFSDFGVKFGFPPKCKYQEKTCYSFITFCERKVKNGYNVCNFHKKIEAKIRKNITKEVTQITPIVNIIFSYIGTE